MLAAVEDVHHRHRQPRRAGAAEIGVERQLAPTAPRRAPPPSTRRGWRSRRACPCSACRRGRSSARRSRAWRVGSRPTSAGAILSTTLATAFVHALAAVARLVAVAQLDRLVLAGRGAGGNASGSMRSVVEAELTFTVGLPRESRISSASTKTILAMANSAFSIRAEL